MPEVEVSSKKSFQFLGLGVVTNYLTELLSNRRRADALDQREVDLDNRESAVRKQVHVLVKRSEVLAKRQAELKEKALGLTAAENRLQCALDTLRAERQTVLAEASAEGLRAVEAECRASRSRALEELQMINQEIEQGRAELTTLEAKVEAFKAVLAGATQSLEVNLKQLTNSVTTDQSVNPGVAQVMERDAADDRPIYLITNVDDLDVNDASVDDARQLSVKNWGTAVLFPKKQPEQGTAKIFDISRALNVQ